MEDRSHEDALMGGGPAPFSLVVQLERRDPGIDVLVAERALHPPPVAAHEVGESTIEVGADYYREVVGLESYLAAEQLRKSGLCWLICRPASTAIRRAQKILAAAQASSAAMLAAPSIPAPAMNSRLLTAARKEDRSGGADAGPDRGGPGRPQPRVIDPQAKVALLRTRRRSEQMVLRPLARNVGHWLSYEVMR